MEIELTKEAANQVADLRDPETRAEAQGYILAAIAIVAKQSHLNTQEQMCIIEPLSEYAQLLNLLAIPG